MEEFLEVGIDSKQVVLQENSATIRIHFTLPSCCKFNSFISSDNNEITDVKIGAWVDNPVLYDLDYDQIYAGGSYICQMVVVGYKENVKSIIIKLQTKFNILSLFNALAGLSRNLGWDIAHTMNLPVYSKDIPSPFKTIRDRIREVSENVKALKPTPEKGDTTNIHMIEEELKHTRQQLLQAKKECETLYKNLQEAEDYIDYMQNKSV